MYLYAEAKQFARVFKLVHHLPVTKSVIEPVISKTKTILTLVDVPIDMNLRLCIIYVPVYRRHLL